MPTFVASGSRAPSINKTLEGTSKYESPTLTKCNPVIWQLVLVRLASLLPLFFFLLFLPGKHSDITAQYFKEQFRAVDVSGLNERQVQ
jgi:hypothetical protein